MAALPRTWFLCYLLSSILIEVAVYFQEFHQKPTTLDGDGIVIRRVKTWLPANMKQQRFNNVSLLHTHNARTDKIRLLDVANEFVQRNENRFRNFGKFTDLDLSKGLKSNYWDFPCV